MHPLRPACLLWALLSLGCQSSGASDDPAPTATPAEPEPASPEIASAEPHEREHDAVAPSVFGEDWVEHERWLELAPIEARVASAVAERCADDAPLDAALLEVVGGAEARACSAATLPEGMRYGERRALVSGAGRRARPLGEERLPATLDFVEDVERACVPWLGLMQRAATGSASRATCPLRHRGSATALPWSRAAFALILVARRLAFEGEPAEGAERLLEGIRLSRRLARGAPLSGALGAVAPVEAWIAQLELIARELPDDRRGAALDSLRAIVADLLPPGLALRADLLQVAHDAREEAGAQGAIAWLAAVSLMGDVERICPLDAEPTTCLSALEAHRETVLEQWRPHQSVALALEGSGEPPSPDHRDALVAHARLTVFNAESGMLRRMSAEQLLRGLL